MTSDLTSKALLLAAALGGSSGCATIKPGEVGILYRSYAHDRTPEVLFTGKHRVAPWNNVAVYDLRWRTALEKADVQTNDRLHLSVPTAVVYRPKADRIVQLHQVIGPGFYESTVRPALLTALRTEFAHRTTDEVVPKAAELQADILKDLREKLADYDVEIASVTFQDLDYPPQLAKTILDQMTAQQQLRNKEAQLGLVRREQEISSVRATGEAESRLSAKAAEAAIAAKDAEIKLIESRAEAEAIRIRSANVTPNYLRLRAIEAQEALAKAPNAKIYFVPLGRDGVPVSLHNGAETDR